MQNLRRVVTRVSSIPSRASIERSGLFGPRVFSSTSGGGGEGEGGPFGGDPSKDLGWGSGSSWSTGISYDNFDGAVAGLRSTAATATAARAAVEPLVNELKEETQSGKSFVDGWGSRFKVTCELVKQAREPGARGSYLKDSEKAEICRLHRKSPEVYTVERLAKDYRVMRQRVVAILWLEELELESKRLGRPLDHCVERLLDDFPEFFESHDQEFHVAALSRKPDFKVMPEDWDGTTRDADEVHFEISQKEDEIMYQKFVQKLDFVKKKVAGEVLSHRYSRRRPSEGWKFTVEKMGPRGKRGGGGGWKFVTMPDGSSRPLNELEKMFLKRETPRPPPRRILPTYRGA